MVTVTPTGLLSFLFHVRYDSDVKEYFHGSSPTVMQKFKLPANVQTAITEMGRDHQSTDQAVRRQRIEAIMKYLTEEFLKDHYEKIW